MDYEQRIDLFLQSQSNSYSQLIMSFNINKLECTFSELPNMFKTVTINIKTSSGQFLAIDSSKGTKRTSKREFGKASKTAKIVQVNKDIIKSNDH